MFWECRHHLSRWWILTNGRIALEAYVLAQIFLPEGPVVKEGEGEGKLGKYQWVVPEDESQRSVAMRRDSRVI
jgi:hypothetical protein